MNLVELRGERRVTVHAPIVGVGAVLALKDRVRERERVTARAPLCVLGLVTGFAGARGRELAAGHDGRETVREQLQQQPEEQGSHVYFAGATAATAVVAVNVPFDNIVENVPPSTRAFAPVPFQA